MNTPAPPRSEFVEPSPKAVAPMPSVVHTPTVGIQAAASIAAPVLAPQVAATHVPALAPQVQLPSPPQAAPPVPASEATRTIVPAPDIPVFEPIKIEPPPPVAVPRPEPAANVARNTPKPPAVVHARPKSRSRNLWALPSAIAMLGAVIYGGYWLQAHGFLSKEEKPEATVAVKERVRDPQPAARPSERANTSARTEPAPRPVKTQAAAPRPAGKPASTVAKARPVSIPAPAPIAAASVAVPAVVTPLPEPLPPAAAAAPSSAPQGPFFEPTQVSEAPRIASRVAPDVPPDLRGHARNEIVIVRMLISQVGRPSRVSLLRKSKVGPRVDDAVIAAVNQWTFSPARRKGEAVSSWFNIGIPVLAD